jgi:hypothetical protein
MPARIPQGGLIGEQAFREATSELRDLVELVRRALQVQLCGTRADCWVSVEAMFADRAIVSRDARLLSYPYTITDDNQVQFGAAVEVTRDFKPVASIVTPMQEAQGAFLEATADTQGLKWQVRVIKAGASGNNNYYPDAALREAVSLFEGARVFVKSDAEHLNTEGKDFRNLIGRLSAPRFVEGAKRDKGEIQATLELLESAGVHTKLLEAWNRGMADLFGFSIDANAQSRKNGRLREAVKFTKVHSLDLIIEPGAGGELIQLIEAINPEAQAEMKLRDRMIEAIKKANKGSLPAGLDVENEDELETAYREAVAGENSGGRGGGVTRDDLRMIEARSEMRVLIAESTLPDVAKQKLRKQFDGMDRFTEADVSAAITGERDYLARFTESGKVAGVGGDGGIVGGEDRRDKVNQMLDDFFGGNLSSFKECYIDITGDKRVTGHLKDCDQARLREAIDTTQFGDVLGLAITRRMLADYRAPSVYDMWRKIVNVVPVNDFRSQERTRVGGYGDLAAVAEKGAYLAVTSPDDEKASYAVTKRGGLETVSLEAIKNDDVGAIRLIPTKLSRAAKRTLGKFVFDFIRTNPNIYDGTALFTVGHGNLGAAALDATSLAARRLAMLNQTELTSGERLGIGPKYLIVPNDLEQTGVDLFARNTNNDKSFINSLSLEVLPVWYWTDANDWALAADPLDIPGLEIGFLDGNEEPELFIQDLPNAGSLFSNDQVTYKIRHVYGGNVTDHRAFDKSVVA